MPVTQMIIAVAGRGAGGGGGPVGSFNYNGTPTNFGYVGGTPPTMVSHTFPDTSTNTVISFDGNGWLQTPSLGSVSSFWFDFWIYPSSYNRQIMAESELGNAESQGYHYSMMEIDSSGYIRAGTWNGGNISSVTSTTTVTANAWNHIYFYYNSGTVSLSVNNDTTVTATGFTRAGPPNTYIGFGQADSTQMTASSRYAGLLSPVYFSTTVTSSRWSTEQSKYRP